MKSSKRDLYLSLGSALSTVIVSHNADYTEYVNFPGKMDSETANFISKYLETLFNMSKSEKFSENDILEISISLNTGRVVTSNDSDFIDFIHKTFSSVNGFTLKVVFHNSDIDYSVDLLDDDYFITLEDGMRGYLENIKDFEDFTYKQACFYPDTEDVECIKIENGKCYIDDEIFNIGDKDIRNWKNPHEWWSFNLELGVSGDELDSHMDICNKLHELIEKYMPNEVQYMEEGWEMDPWVIACGSQWLPKNLEEIDCFCREFNEIITPIADKCELHAECFWLVHNEYALAALRVIDNKLTYVACKY